jgi:hypothetical protein
MVHNVSASTFASIAAFSCPRTFLSSARSSSSENSMRTGFYKGYVRNKNDCVTMQTRYNVWTVIILFELLGEDAPPSVPDIMWVTTSLFTRAREHFKISTEILCNTPSLPSADSTTPSNGSKYRYNAIKGNRFYMVYLIIPSSSMLGE